LGDISGDCFRIVSASPNLVRANQHAVNSCGTPLCGLLHTDRIRERLEFPRRTIAIPSNTQRRRTMYDSFRNGPNAKLATNRRPLWKALLVMGALLVPVWGAAPAGAATVRTGSALRGVDLPGQDYRSISARSYRKCSRTCENEAQCKAWTFVAPGTPGAHGVCWLKHAVPPQQPNARTTSGIKSQTGSESLVLMPGSGTAGRLPRGERTNVTTRDHRRSRAPAASTTLSCDNGKAYKLTTGTEEGRCTLTTSCAETSPEGVCLHVDRTVTCIDSAKASGAKADCDFGCLETGGKGDCGLVPSG
jgi:hypothetical protein